jgi:hypothetical protein
MFDTFASEYDNHSNAANSNFAYSRMSANSEFDRNFMRRRVAQLAIRLFPQKYAMKELAQVMQDKRVYDRHEEGLQRIRITDIVGSESKAYKFDHQFTPLHEDSRERWVRMAQAYLSESPIPPVQLIRLGCEYYVRDGHHRISVARALGAEYIDAEVTAWEISSVPVCRPVRLQAVA